MTSLKRLLRANAVSCLGFGLLFLLIPGAVAAGLGTAPKAFVAALGAGLVLNAAHLLLAARGEGPSPALVIWFSLGDLGWWLASLGLIGAGVWITTPTGQALSITVGAMVAGLGAAQLFALGKHRFGLSSSGLWRRLGQSWKAMPLWVKLWLTLLNALFLAAFAFWPAPLATVPLLAYLASGPVLLGMAAAQGGLTRALGVAHLVTYAPILPWLLGQSQATGAAGPYAMVLASALVICLAFDLWDLLRYLRGEREPLGHLPQPLGSAH